MNIVGIIPARLGSQRFPNKPMVDILGIPMIGHVYLRSKLSTKLGEVCVATCDEEIREYIESIGGRVVMTSDRHKRASERTAEAVQKLEVSTGVSFDFVLMIQGDLPTITPTLVDEMISPIERDRQIRVVDLISEIHTKDDFENANNVKVVMDLNDFALYYSREPIPSRKKFDGQVPMWRQPGLILFAKETLLEFVRLQPTPLEVIESVDMNRLLEHGVTIQFHRTKDQLESIDVPEDRHRVIEKLKSDPFYPQYAKTL
jgi:3-deoxy-manno-octulosonate cytidylyltransferase (CMP-KDO synthetase)